MTLQEWKSKLNAQDKAEEFGSFWISSQRNNNYWGIPCLNEFEEIWVLFLYKSGLKIESCQRKPRRTNIHSTPLSHFLFPLGIPPLPILHISSKCITQTPILILPVFVIFSGLANLTNSNISSLCDSLRDPVIHNILGTTYKL